MKLWLSRLIKKVLDSALLKSVVVQAILKAIGATSGFLGWLLKVILGHAFEIGRKLLRREVVKVEVQEENKQELKEYEKKINAPNASAEDIRKAGKKFLEG